jgi:hypothetical protein
MIYILNVWVKPCLKRLLNPIWREYNPTRKKYYVFFYKPDQTNQNNSKSRTGEYTHHAYLSLHTSQIMKKIHLHITIFFLIYGYISTLRGCLELCSVPIFSALRGQTPLASGTLLQKNVKLDANSTFFKYLKKSVFKFYTSTWS